MAIDTLPAPKGAFLEGSRKPAVVVPFRVVLHSPSKDQKNLVGVLEALLSGAKEGSITGLIFGASVSNRRVFCESAGVMCEDTMLALGVAAMLTAQLQQRIMGGSEPKE